MANMERIDLTPRETRTVVYDESGKALAQKSGEYPMFQPKNGWAEQEPLD